MNRLILLVILLFASVGVSHAATIQAASCERAAVNTAISFAKNDDTVVIPAGSCKWTTGITFVKALTITGAGCARDAKNRAVNPCGTTIADNLPAGPGGGTLLRWTTVPGHPHRLAGIKFTNGGRTSNGGNPTVSIASSNAAMTTVRIDGNYFYRTWQTNGQSIVCDTCIGVMDHNTIESASSTPLFIYSSRYADMASCPAAFSPSYGDGSWCSSVDWNSSAFLFIENNTILRIIAGGGACIDAYGGARYVVRFNDFTNCSIAAGHGTDSTGRMRAVRAVQAYRNTVNRGKRSELTENRDGDFIVWGNTGTDMVSPPYAGILSNYRSVGNFPPWGEADGRNPWDVNDTGNPFATGMATGGSATTLTVAGAPWAVNQWAQFANGQRYVIRKINCNNHPVTGSSCSSIILSNTANTITFLPTSAAARPTGLNFTLGGSFEINKVTRTIDQPGRGQGSYVSNIGYPSPPLIPGGWNDQVDYPSLQWLNTGNGAIIGWANSSCASCIMNVTYFDYKPSFNGTTGIGAGLRSARPATCTAGVYYWSTDRGTWNTSGNGGQGVLDKCTSTNTWTDNWYQPYGYPHQLSLGAPASTNDY